MTGLFIKVQLYSFGLGEDFRGVCPSCTQPITKTRNITNLIYEAQCDLFANNSKVDFVYPVIPSKEATHELLGFEIRPIWSQREDIPQPPKNINLHESDEGTKS